MAHEILIVDDEPNIRRALSLHFESRGHRVRAVATAGEALDALGDGPADIAFVDLRLGTESGLDLIPRLQERSPSTAVVVITAHGSLDSAIEALKLGVRDYVRKPFKPAELDLVIGRIQQVDRLQRRYEALASDVADRSPEILLETESPEMGMALDTARRAARSDTPILIRGPSGCGKGVLAREIHRLSRYRDGPFVVIPCPTLPSELLESELFGHVRGAFTGATRDRPGRVQLAEGGTLLLDEIGDLPPALQAKLLRFIEDKAYERVGDSQTRHADVRILAATHRDLEAAVEAGEFRADLLYRLDVIGIDLPGLVDRPGDILPLARHFLDFFARHHDRPGLSLTGEAERLLQAHDWPGNVRELRNVLERAVILADGAEIGPDRLGLAPAEGEPGPRVGGSATLAELEEEHLRRIVARADSFREAAEILGIDEATLWRRRKKYGMEEA